jgi:putative transposase
MLNLTYEYKLIPTDKQRETFDQWINICCKVYNFALQERKDWVNSRKCDIALLNKMRYTPLATDALCPMPYALCPMPARAPHVTEKGYINSCSIKQEYIIPSDAPRPSFACQCKSLAFAKKSIPELKLPHTHVLQQALRQLEAAFVGMWKRGHGFPRFKKRMRSEVFPQLNLESVKHFNGADWVNLPKIGLVKMHLSRPIPEGFEVKQIRVVKKASGYYA